MKKVTLLLVLLALGAMVNHSFSQVRKVTLTSLTSLPGKVVAVHKDSTANPTDTFYTRVVGYVGMQNVTGKIYRRIGGGVHYDTITLTPYVRYTFAVQIADDSATMTQMISDTLSGMAIGYPSVLPVSTTLISVTPIVNGIILKHLDSTVNVTDTFWSMPERSFNSNFFPALPCNKIKRVGGGVYSDTIMYPLVNPGTTSYLRMAVGDFLFTNKKTSGIQTSTPLFPVTDPTLTIGTITPTNNGGYYSHTWDPGYDSATIIRSVSIYPDSTFQYSWDSSWKVVVAGTSTMQIVGMPSNKKIYVRETITNSKTSITKTFSWTTLSEPAKPFIYKNIDSVVVGETTSNIGGKITTNGLNTSVKAIYGSTVLATDSVLGTNGTSNYYLKLTNLTPNTNYTIKLKAENAKGSDSVMVSFTTLIHNSQTFFIVTDSLIRQAGSTKAHMYGRVNIVNGTSEVYGGLFTDQTCALALSPSSGKITSSKIGINNLYVEFDVDTTTNQIWGRFWGTDDKGRFDLNPTPTKLRVIYFTPTTGIENIQKDNQISVYPNPASDMLNVPSVFGQYEIFNFMGQKIKSESIDSQVDVSSFPNGMYFIRSEKITQSFIKN